MSENKERTMSIKKIMNMLAFIGLVAVAIAITVTAMLNLFNWGSPNAINILRTIGEAIAYLITIFYAFFFIRGKKHPAWAITYAICATIILVLMFFR